MTHPDSFRQRAAECRENARHARDPKNRARWTEMAEHWLQLADEQDLAAHRWHGLGPAHWAALDSTLRRADDRRSGGAHGGSRPSLSTDERAA